jgi:hypothetical protein
MNGRELYLLVSMLFVVVTAVPTVRAREKNESSARNLAELMHGRLNLPSCLAGSVVLVRRASPTRSVRFYPNPSLQVAPEANLYRVMITQRLLKLSSRNEHNLDKRGTRRLASALELSINSESARVVIICAFDNVPGTLLLERLEQASDE